MDATYTLEEFVAEWQITASTEKIPERPDGPFPPSKGTHWRCVLSRPMERNDSGWRIRREYDNRWFTPDPYEYEDWVRVDDTEFADEDGDVYTAPLTVFMTTMETEPPTAYDILCTYLSDAASFENIRPRLGHADAQLVGWLGQWHAPEEKFTIAELRIMENGFQGSFLAATRLEIWLGQQAYDVLLATER
jgi:hypothetical protein